MLLSSFCCWPLIQWNITNYVSINPIFIRFSVKVSPHSIWALVNRVYIKYKLIVWYPYFTVFVSRQIPIGHIELLSENFDLLWFFIYTLLHFATFPGSSEYVIICSSFMWYILNWSAIKDRLVSFTDDSYLCRSQYNIPLINTRIYYSLIRFCTSVLHIEKSIKS